MVWKVSRNGDLVKKLRRRGPPRPCLPGRRRDISFGTAGAVLQPWTRPKPPRMDLKGSANGQIDRSMAMTGIARRTEMATVTISGFILQRLVPDRNGRGPCWSPLTVMPGTSCAIQRTASRQELRHRRQASLRHRFRFQSKDGQKPMYLPGLIKINGTALGWAAVSSSPASTRRNQVRGQNQVRGFPVRSYGKPGSCPKRRPAGRAVFPQAVCPSVRDRGSPLKRQRHRDWPAVRPASRTGYPTRRSSSGSSRTERSTAPWQAGFLEPWPPPRRDRQQRLTSDGKKTVVAGSLISPPERSNFPADSLPLMTSAPNPPLFAPARCPCFPGIHLDDRRFTARRRSRSPVSVRCRAGRTRCFRPRFSRTDRP